MTVAAVGERREPAVPRGGRRQGHQRRPGEPPARVLVQLEAGRVQEGQHELTGRTLRAGDTGWSVSSGHWTGITERRDRHH